MAEPVDYLGIARRVIQNRADPPMADGVATRQVPDANSKPLETVLKGCAVELWSDAMGRLFLVADEEDARLAIERLRVCRGEIYAAAEVRCVARVTDRAIVTEIHEWKRKFDGTVRECRRPSDKFRT